MLNQILILTSITYLMLFTVTALLYAAGSSAPCTIQSVTAPYIQIHDALAKDSLGRSFCCRHRARGKRPERQDISERT